MTEFFVECIFSNDDPFDRQGSSSAQGGTGSFSLPPLPGLALSTVPVLTMTMTVALWLHVYCCSHRLASNRRSRLQVSTCSPHMAYLLKRHRCDPGCVQFLNHNPTASCSCNPCGNTSCALCHYRKERCWCRLTETHSTVGSIINFVFPSFHGFWAWPAKILLILYSSECGFHAVVLQKASVHIPHISEQFLVCTSNTDLAILMIKTPLSLTLQFSHTRLTPQAKVHTWGMV